MGSTSMDCGQLLSPKQWWDLLEGLIMYIFWINKSEFNSFGSLI